MRKGTDRSTGQRSGDKTRRLDAIHVLFVDDAPDDRRTLPTWLQQAGADLTLECNGEAALVRIEKDPSRYDAVVVDLTSITEGVATTRRLREAGYEGVIVGIPKGPFVRNSGEWSRAGCDRCLREPLDPQTLIAAIWKPIAPVE